MLDKYIELCKSGLYFPFVNDPTTGKPSITLLFPFMSGMMLTASLIALHFDTKFLIGTLVSFLFWATSMIFYMIRQLNKAKINLEQKSIDLEGGKNE